MVIRFVLPRPPKGPTKILKGEAEPKTDRHAGVSADGTTLKPNPNPNSVDDDIHMVGITSSQVIATNALLFICEETHACRLDSLFVSNYANRSHRDFALNHWQDSRLREDLAGRYPKRDHAPLAAGESVASPQRLLL